MITIHFNGKNFDISEADLSAASEVLKSHLSSAMSGTGAQITLDGTSYNIDSTKLSAATNTFISHLGTVSGSGYKVKVGSIEYGVDSSKVAGAISELEVALDGLESGGGNSGNIIVFDGNYSKYEYVDMQGVYMVHMSDKVLSAEDLLGATAKYVWGEKTGDCIIEEDQMMAFEDAGLVGVNGVSVNVLFEHSNGSSSWLVSSIISIGGDLSAVQSVGLPFTKEGTYFMFEEPEYRYIKSVSCLTE